MHSKGRRPSFSPDLSLSKRTPLFGVDNRFTNIEKSRKSKLNIVFSIPSFEFSYEPKIIDHLYSQQNSKEMLADILQSDVTTAMRSKLIEWMFTVCNNFHMPKNIIFSAVAIFDKSLCKMSPDKNKLQLLGATSIFISVKMQSLNTIPITELVKECANMYTGKDFINCEKDILNAINYDVNIPTVADFIEMNETEISKFKALHCVVWVLTNIQLQFSSFLRFKASTVSTAIIIYSTHCFGGKLNQEFLITLASHEDWKELYMCVEELERVVTMIIGRVKTTVMEKIETEEFLRAKKYLLNQTKIPIKKYCLLFPNIKFC